MSQQREVALVIDPTKPYDRRIIRGVAAYVRQEAPDWSLYVEEDPVNRLPAFDSWAGDGILANFDYRRVAQAISKLGIPAVGVGGGYGYYEQSTNIPYVKTDNKAIAELAAQHLLDLGLKYFAFCGIPHDRSNGWARERQSAFKQYVSAAGYSCNIFTDKQTSARQWSQLQSSLKKWLRSLPNPIGIMACNDSRARHVMQACRSIGLRVPEDIAIVGVDNDDIMCELSRPSLTSVEQGARQVGYEAASILDALMAGTRPQLRMAVPPEGIVERQSTNILAVDDVDVCLALKFIRQHACDPIQVQDVLRIASMSRSTLEARFQRHLGRSVHAEIRRVQLEKAKNLLKTSNLSIKEIVREVGSSSVQYFTAMVRKATGETPGQIRDKANQ